MPAPFILASAGLWEHRLPEEVPQAQHPQRPIIALRSAALQAHARASGTFLIEQTDKGAWGGLSKFGVIGPRGPVGSALLHQLPPRPVLFILFF